MALEGKIKFGKSYENWAVTPMAKIKKGHCFQVHHPKINENIDLTYRSEESLDGIEGVRYFRKRIKEVKDRAEEDGQPCIVISDPEPIPAQSPGDKAKVKLTLLHCTSKHNMWYGAKVLVPFLDLETAKPDWCKNEPLRDVKFTQEVMQHESDFVVCIEKFTLTVYSDSVVWARPQLSVSEEHIKQLHSILKKNKEEGLIVSIKAQCEDREYKMAQIEARDALEQQDKAREQDKKTNKEAKAAAKDRQINAKDVPSSLTNAGDNWAKIKEQGEASASSQKEGSGAGADTEAPSTTPGQEKKKPRFVAKISKKPAWGPK